MRVGAGCASDTRCPGHINMACVRMLPGYEWWVVRVRAGIEFALHNRQRVTRKSSRLVANDPVQDVQVSHSLCRPGAPTKEARP